MNKAFAIATISLISLSMSLNAQILLTISYDTDLMSSANSSSTILKRLPAHKNVELLDFIPEGEDGSYFQVQVFGLTGYVSRNSVNHDDVFYIALNVRNGNSHKLYLENKEKIDNLNKQKMHEEELWVKKDDNSKVVTVASSPSIFDNDHEEKNNSREVNKPSREINNSTPSKASIIIQMRKMTGGTYEIPCKVNGLALNFIFDTGASDVSISLTEAIFMLKNGYLSEEDIIGTHLYSIANGEIAEGTTIKIKKLEIQGLILRNVEASIVHELQAPLLLGQTAISRLGKIQIDPQNSTLTIIR